MIIYRATRKDIDFITKLWKKLSDYHKPFEDYIEPSSKWKQYMKTVFLEDLEREDRLILVARDGNRYVGFVRGEIRNASEIFNNKLIGYISDLFVEDCYRSTGIAQKLMESQFHWFKARGIKKVRLNVNSQNSKALRFYEKLGFKEVNKTLSLKI